MCFSSFAVDRTDVADRLSISLTMFLAAIAYQYVIAGMLPTSSTMTIMQYYINSGFGTISALVIDYSISSQLSEVNGWWMDAIIGSIIGKKK